MIYLGKYYRILQLNKIMMIEWVNKDKITQSIIITEETRLMESERCNNCIFYANCQYFQKQQRQRVKYIQSLTYSYQFPKSIICFSQIHHFLCYSQLFLTFLLILLNYQSIIDILMPKMKRIILVLNNNMEVLYGIIHTNDLEWMRIRTKLSHSRSCFFREIINKQRPFVAITQVFHYQEIFLLEGSQIKAHSIDFEIICNYLAGNLRGAQYQYLLIFGGKQIDIGQQQIKEVYIEQQNLQNRVGSALILNNFQKVYI